MTDDAALQRLGRLVRQMDLGVGTMAEEAGMMAILQGARQRGLDDPALLETAKGLFDNLYAAFTVVSGE